MSWTKKTWKRRCWPNICDQESATRAAKTAANMAFFVSGGTAFLWSLSVFKMSALIDVVLFAAVGIGIRCMWTSASVMGLLLYLAKVGNGIAHAPGLVVVSILTTLIFTNGIRGTIAYRKFVTR